MGHEREWRAAPGTFELGTDGPGAIVVGVDGSDSSLRAAAYAAGLARRQRSRLVAVYVRALPTPMLSIADRCGAAVTAAIAAQDEIETGLRAAAGARVPHLDIPAELVVRHGDPFAELTDAAMAVRADAVVVGRSMSARHRIAGSLAVRLVRSGRWPVTVVP
ncbi:universal stress protein [Dactylosporangium sp. CA-092794]|uniref:universal stress protein n=1 Tax=Dactylosporangium sp. CA-092794 TaxID=3239929 RepID=UPI003D918B91